MYNSTINIDGVKYDIVVSLDNDSTIYITLRNTITKNMYNIELDSNEIYNLTDNCGFRRDPIQLYNYLLYGLKNTNPNKKVNVVFARKNKAIHIKIILNLYIIIDEQIEYLLVLNKKTDIIRKIAKYRHRFSISYEEFKKSFIDIFVKKENEFAQDISSYISDI